VEGQLVILHFTNYCLGPIPTTLPPNKLSVFDLLSVWISEESKPKRKRKIKKPHLAVVSINTTSRGRDLMRSRKGRQGVRALLISFSDLDYNPGFSQILIEPEGAF